MTDLKQLELDQFEDGLFALVFGEDYYSSSLYKMAVLTYGKQINGYISRFEALMEPLMLDSGLVDGHKLKQIVSVKYPQYAELIPAANFRLIALLDIVKSIGV